jgi:hypothetical protein
MSTAASQPTLKARILKTLSKKDKGWAFTPHDFADLGDPRTVGMTLTRLVRDGTIRRLGRGIYDRPQDHPLLGKAGATSDSVVAAVARKKNLRILPSAAVAANKLGVSTQVPAKIVYHTDGAPSTVNLGKLKIEFRRNSGSMLALADRPSGLVAQALRDIGKDKVTAAHLQRLRTNLPADARKSLAKDLNRVPAWMRPHFKELSR